MKQEEDDILQDNAVQQGNRQNEEDLSEHDVKLEIPKLKAEEIKLKVDNLKGKISLSANIVQFVQIEAGADVQLENVELELKGLEAEAQLKVKLERVRHILQRTMETIDRNPELLKSLLKPAAEGSGQTTARLTSPDV